MSATTETKALSFDPDQLRAKYEQERVKRLRFTRAGEKMSALAKAYDTAYNPVGGEAQKRSETISMYAQRGRKRVGAPLDTMMLGRTTKQRASFDRRATARRIALNGASVRQPAPVIAESSGRLDPIGEE